MRMNFGCRCLATREFLFHQYPQKLLDTGKLVLCFLAHELSTLLPTPELLYLSSRRLTCDDAYDNLCKSRRFFRRFVRASANRT